MPHWIHNGSDHLDAISDYRTILGVCITLPIIMTIVVGISVYTRIKLLESIGIDDWIIFFSAVGSLSDTLPYLRLITRTSYVPTKDARTGTAPIETAPNGRSRAKKAMRSGQMTYSCAVTQTTWQAGTPQQWAVRPPMEIDEEKNRVPGHRDSEEHVAFIFNAVQTWTRFVATEHPSIWT
ncbi:MAG: hypothetical protein Q9226_001363 [Calogaya cf. arnoldii]